MHLPRRLQNECPLRAKTAREVDLGGKRTFATPAAFRAPRALGFLVNRMIQGRTRPPLALQGNGATVSVSLKLHCGFDFAVGLQKDHFKKED